MKISVIIKDPGQKPRYMHISDTIENLQKTVGGYVEMVKMCSDLAILCDEDGRLKKLPYCGKILGRTFVGTIIICGIKDTPKGVQFADIPASYETIKKILPSLWEEGK